MTTLTGRRARGPGAARNRPGFSLVEMLVAMTIFGVIFAAAIAMLSQQVGAFSRASEGSAALQNMRFSVEELARAGRAAGISLGDGQPMLVYAGSDVVAFNGDYMSKTAFDLDAIFVDTGATVAATTELMKGNRFTLPGTSFSYPDTSYPGEHKAETLIFFFRPDSTTSRTDDYILFRQINREPAEVVARDLQRTGSAAFFQYLRLRSPATGATVLDSVATSTLPLTHSVPLHLVQGDTGRLALIDSVRAVRVQFTASNGASGRARATLAVSRVIRLPNAGMQAYQTCGDPPLSPGSFALTLVTASGVSVPHLSWTASSDEAGGEKDVVRYVIYRVVGGWGGTLGDPYFNLPASGAASYTWTDTRVDPNTNYTYAVAAEDCTPQVGPSTATSSVTTPP